MKRESTAARLERLERRFRRLQALSITAIALMACAMLAGRGASQEEPLTNGSFEKLAAKKLTVDAIEVQRLSIVGKDGNDSGGSWTTLGDGTSAITLNSPQGMIRFQATSGPDPVLVVNPNNGKSVRVPVAPAP
jgi:hypothetical protein